MDDAIGTKISADRDDNRSFIPERANSVTTRDWVDEFLIDHHDRDIFEINEQRDSATPSRSWFNYKSVKKSDDAEKGTRERSQVTLKLSLAALSRMRMRMLQLQLTDIIMNIHYSKTLPDNWESLLEKYIAATRDNDYIRTCADRDLHDPFLIRSQRNVDAAVLKAALLEIPAEKLEEGLFVPGVGGTRELNFAPPLEREPTAIGGTRAEMTQKERMDALLTRVLISIIVGAFLTVPMWLMISVTTPYASPIITTVFVFVAGIAAARVLDNDLAVVSATAAYAAVLVVFVGANGSST